MAEHAYHHESADDQYLETPPGAGYEHTDADAGVMVKFAFWLVVSAVLVHVGLGAMYWLPDSSSRRSRRPGSSVPCSPRERGAAPAAGAAAAQQSGVNDMYDFLGARRKTRTSTATAGSTRAPAPCTSRSRMRCA